MVEMKDLDQIVMQEVLEQPGVEAKEGMVVLVVLQVQVILTLV